MNDELRKQRVIHLLEWVLYHNEATHKQNVGIMNDAVSLWMKNCDML